MERDPSGGEGKDMQRVVISVSYVRVIYPCLLIDDPARSLSVHKAAPCSVSHGYIDRPGPTQIQ